MKVNITYPTELTYRLSQLKLTWLLPAKKEVKITNSDLWSLGSSLGFVILECLKAYRDKVRSFGIVDNEDLPEEFHLEEAEDGHLRTFDAEQDAKVEAGWKWAIDEMIWAFNTSVDDSWDEEFFKSTSEENEVSVGGSLVRAKFDKEGYDKARERILNGRRLFAKYFDSLWY
jgi:hypothetical protein